MTDTLYGPSEMARAEALYKAYPRHVAHLYAIACIRKAMKANAYDTLMDGVLRYAAYVKFWRPEMRFVPHPSTWFNRGQWDDELPTQPTSGPPQAEPGKYERYQ